VILHYLYKLIGDNIVEDYEFLIIIVTLNSKLTNQNPNDDKPTVRPMSRQKIVV